MVVRGIEQKWRTKRERDSACSPLVKSAPRSRSRRSPRRRRRRLKCVASHPAALTPQYYSR